MLLLLLLLLLHLLLHAVLRLRHGHIRATRLDESLRLWLLLHRLAIVHLLLLLLHMRSIVEGIRLLDSLLLLLLLLQWLLGRLVLRLPQPGRCSSIATKGSECTGREAKLCARETLLQGRGFQACSWHTVLLLLQLQKLRRELVLHLAIASRRSCDH